MSPAEKNGPLAPFLARGRPLIADGGLATALEARGHRLGTRLWSAELLVSNPDAIRDIHAEYLAAGADCVSTASYQASFAGFREQGYGDAEAAGLLELSVALAVEARDRYWAVQGNRPGRLRPLVAASAGPYGAYLADGSEYDGRYGVEFGVLDEFHRRRFRLLARSAADLILCETIPSGLEVEALLGILEDTPDAWVWMSFCCADGARLWDGTPVEEVARLCDRADRVVAVGVNCVAPAHVGALIGRIRTVTDLPAIVYPNSGEVYDARTGTWHWPANGAGGAGEPIPDAGDWIARGAAGVGGCCRVGPAEIRALRRQIAGVPLAPFGGSPGGGFGPSDRQR
ncbi:MAG: homocysteine S-methyltransferase [Gammaproteobacteria bacterium]|nr:homocysteine S-methyltransferase [Gammaproteobacteria bacterium]